MEEITNRISTIIKYFNLTAGSFADKLGVQRSGLSHILSGRNKPSLDFIIKVTDAFEEIDINWLLHGKGQFPKTIDFKDTVISPSPKTEKTVLMPHEDIKTNVPEPPKNSKSEVIKIVMFYTDGTFQEFVPSVL